MSAVAKMSKKAADVLFGGAGASTDFDADLYELRKLADQVIAALDARPLTGLRIAGVGDLLSIDFIDPEIPLFEWSLPMPEWLQADFSVPAVTEC